MPAVFRPVSICEVPGSCADLSEDRAGGLPAAATALAGPLSGLAAVSAGRSFLLPEGER
jgi:hypothetical protein